MRRYHHYFSLAFIAICLLPFPKIGFSQSCVVSNPTSNVYVDASRGNTITADLSWANLADGELYQVDYKSTSTGISMRSLGLLSNEYNIYNLNPNDTYSWRVRAQCNGVWQPWSDYNESFVTPDGFSCEVEGLRAVPYVNSDGTISAALEWDELSIGDVYQVDYQSTSTGKNIRSLGLLSNEYNIYNLNPNDTYSWRVRAQCNGVWQPWSDYNDSFVTPDGFSCEVKGLRAVPYVNSDGTISAALEWDELSIGDVYQVDYKSTSTGINIRSLGLLSNEYNIYNLNPNDTYSWRVRAQCNGVWQPWETYNDSFTTPDGKKCAVNDYQSTVYEAQDGVIEASLSWTTEVPAEQFQVQYRQGSSVYTTSQIGSMQTIVSGLEVDKVYEWRVRVFCHGQWLPWPPFQATFSTDVRDTTPPVVATRNIIAQLDETGVYMLDPNSIDNGSYDDEEIQFWQLSQTNFDCDDVGENTVTLTLTDLSGNVASADAIVTIVDNTPPIVATQDLILSISSKGTVSINTTDVDNGSSDACGIASMELNQFTFDCDDVGENVVTLTVTDNSGNVTIAESTITIIDDTAPEILTNNYTLILDGTGQGTLTFANVDAGTNDECGLESVSLDRTTFTCADAGEHTINVTAVDTNGNEAQATVIVTVVDESGPDVQASFTSLENGRWWTRDIYELEYGATDQCGEVSEISGVITTPDFSDYSVKYRKSRRCQKLKVDTKKKKLYVYAKNPQAFVNSLNENGGIAVDNGQKSKIRTRSGHKYYYLFYKDYMYYASGPSFELLATATDIAGNTTTATDQLGSITTGMERIGGETEDLEDDPNYELEFISEVYPNPGNGAFNVKLSNINTESAIHLTMFDVNGSMIQQITHEPAQHEYFGEVKIGNQSLEPGVYFIQVANGYSQLVKKVVVTR